MALLLHRGWFGVPLGDNQAAQLGAIFAGHVLPHRFAPVIAERDFTVQVGLGQKYPPAVIRHLDEAEVGPSVALDADGIRASERQVRLNGQRYRYQRIDATEVLHLLENPEGTIPIHRASPAPDRQSLEDLISAFRRRE